LVTANASFVEVVITLVLQIFVGTLVGYGTGNLINWATNHLQFDSKGLYPVASLARVLLIYGVATLCKGNGFLAVYVAGIVIGNCQFSHKETIIDFHEGISWLMQITMFLGLGLLVFPSELPAIAPVAIVISLFLMFIARPLSVFVSLAWTKYNWCEKLFISWVGLRGSVPIILAIAPITVSLPDAKIIFNVVFFIVLFSVSIQGFTLAPTARWLKLVK
jgi:cell volume regulation protein A